MTSSDFPPLPVFEQSSSVLNVDPNEPDAIGACIARAPEGSTIIIPAGEYKECLTIEKNIQLIGDGEVFLTASSPTDSFTVNARVYVKNIQIKPGSSQCSSAVNLLAGCAVFESCTISSPFMPPIITHEDGYLYFNTCTITSTEAAVMFASKKIKVEFQKCVISSPQTVGIIASEDSQVRMIQTKLENCGDSGIIILDRASLQMESCNVEGNGGDAIELNTQSQNNIITATAIKNHEKGSALNCSGPGHLSISNCEINTCTAGILAGNGFTVEASTNAISNVSKSALVCATNGSTITLNGDNLSGECLLAIISDSKSQVLATGVNINNIKSTGSSVTGGSKLVFTQCVFNKITECAIEAHDDATLEVDSCQFSEIESIGILVQTNVRGFVKNTVISTCGIVGCHFVDNTAEFEFQQVSFQANGGNGLNIKNTSAVFTECAFIQNQASGIEARGAETKPTFDKCQFNQNAVVGVNISEGAAPIFKECVIGANAGSGFYAEGASPSLEVCSVVQNGENGILAMSGAQVTCSQCSIKGNLTFGAQIETSGTCVTFKQCEISEQPQAGGVIINESAIGVFEGSNLSANNGPQVECRNNGQARITNCQLFQSLKGIGLQITAGGFAEVNSSVFHDEQQAGIVVGDGGNCNVQGCELYNCQVCAIYLLSGSKGNFKKNHIHNNASVGINIMAGSVPSILENTIENHSNYGINVALGAEPQVIDNVFNNNGTMDVNRE